MKLNVLFLSTAEDYISALSDSEQGKIAAQIETMRSGYFTTVNTKKLKGSIREMIIDCHRLIYFIDGNSIYFVSGFRKKSQKTPKKEIEFAEKIYKMTRRK